MIEETIKTRDSANDTVPRKRSKKRNPFVAYFVPFGLRQITDLLMIAGAITILVGLIIHGLMLENLPVIIGMAMYAVASLIAIFRCIRVFANKDISKKSQEHKNAVVNIVIMSILLALAVLGIVAAILW